MEAHPNRSDLQEPADAAGLRTPTLGPPTYEAEFTIDIRGRLGNRAVRQHFQTVRLEATVVTIQSEDRLREVVEETEARCPVYNLINDAGVNLEVRWIRKLPS